MPPVLAFDRVTKQYPPSLFSRGRQPLIALEDFSLAIEPGEIFGFLGPNGAGKSTAIHIAMGFLQPTRGGGSMLGKPFGHARTRARVGFLAENVALYHRPAERLVRFYGALNRMRGEALRRRTREVLEQLELSAESERNVGKFSRGMLQRVGLAQALVNDPDLLVLDEPTSALDPRARVIVRELLLDARNVGKTVFVSSHLLSEVEMICDRVAILHRGRIVRAGRTSELLESHDQAEIVARGISTEALPGAVARDGVVRFTVPTQAQRAAIERVWATGGEVVSVNPLRRSLEDIFVELTSGGEKGARS
jgi:ABC-2 type transport system ATP-binding protein